MEPRYTIGVLAREAGVPASTVRYYERSRLLRPDGRTEGNYRVYGPEALERLRFIRAAQAIGLTLEDITTLLDFRDGRTAPCREVQILIEERLSELKKRLAQLRHVQSILHSSLRMCRQTEGRGRCEVIEKTEGCCFHSRGPAHSSGILEKIHASPLTLNPSSRSRLSYVGPKPQRA